MIWLWPATGRGPGWWGIRRGPRGPEDSSCPCPRLPPESRGASRTQWSYGPMSPTCPLLPTRPAGPGGPTPPSPDVPASPSSPLGPSPPLAPPGSPWTCAATGTRVALGTMERNQVARGSGRSAGSRLPVLSVPAPVRVRVQQRREKSPHVVYPHYVDDFPFPLQNFFYSFKRKRYDSAHA
ncbi:hypothetical protein [Red-eared slider ranavirus]|nr:hypothetical protein [Red-eared slider ranavirus]